MKLEKVGEVVVVSLSISLRKLSEDGDILEGLEPMYAFATSAGEASSSSET